MITIEERGFRLTTREKTRQREATEAPDRKTSVFDPQRSCTRRPQVAGFRLSRRRRPGKRFPVPHLDSLHTAIIAAAAPTGLVNSKVNEQKKRKSTGNPPLTTSSPALSPTVTYSSDRTLITRGPSRHVRAVHAKAKRCREATTQRRVVRCSAPFFGRAYTVFVGCA